MEDILSTVQGLVLSGWRFWAEGGQVKFRAPQQALAGEVLSQLRERKSEILNVLEQSPEHLELSPLSYGQRAMWFLWKLAPESYAYHLSLPIKLAADTSAATWRQACHQLVARHPQLRTNFGWHVDQPIQRVNPPGTLDWVEIDATSLAPDELAERMQAEHRRAFDLERDPMLRCRWVRGSDEITLLVTCHHIVNDAWSQGLMLRELDLLAAGEDPGPEPTTSYRDFVHEERACIEGEQGQRLWDYWRRQLAPPLPLLELPHDKPRPVVPSFRGGTVATTLTADLTERLKPLATQARVPISSMILAGLGVVLMRASGQNELLVGMPLLGRNRPDLVGVVGYFVDPVVVRMRFPAGRPFRAFLSEVHDSVVEAVDHGNFPFALLVERLAPNRDASRSPLFDVLFNHLRHAGHRGDDLDMVPIAQVEGQFDITLTVTEATDRLELVLRYSEDLFLEPTARRFLDELVELLDTASTDPEKPMIAPTPRADAGVAETQAPSTPASPMGKDSGAGPLTTTEQRLAAIWSELLGIESPGRNDDFFVLGGHSLLAVRLAARIEEMFGINLPIAQVLRTRTLSGLARCIETTRLLPEDTPQILIPMRTSGTHVPVIAIPGSGGNILYLEPLVRRLDDAQPVWGLQALGLESRDAPIPERVEDMAASYLELLHQQQSLTGPVALIGHSFGGLLAFEMARQLHASDGPNPLFVGILDIVAPGGLPEEKIRTWSDKAWLEHIGVRMENLFGIDLDLHSPAFENVTQQARLDRMVDQLTSTGLLPADLGPQDLARFAQIYKENSLASIRYRPEPMPSDLQVTLFKAAVDDPDLHHQLRGPAKIDERTLGWDRYAEAPVEVIEVAGTHLSMLTPPSVDDLAEKLNVALASRQP